MNSPSSSSRIMLLADRRTPPASGSVRIRRYRLARLAPGVRRGGPAPRLGGPKRVQVG